MGEKSSMPLMEDVYVHARDSTSSSDAPTFVRGDRLVKPLSAIGFTVALACLCSTAANLYFFIAGNGATANAKQSCFSCHDVEDYPVDWDKVTIDHDVCCMPQTEFLKLVEKVSLNVAKSEFAKVLPASTQGSNVAAVSGARPSAHLGLEKLPPWTITKPEGNVREDMTEIVKWNTGSNGHIRGGLTLKNGRLTINSTGFYHVYSQVSSEDRRESTTSIQRHSIFRLSSFSSTPEELLTSEMVYPEPLGQFGRLARSSSVAEDRTGLDPGLLGKPPGQSPGIRYESSNQSWHAKRNQSPPHSFPLCFDTGPKYQ